MKLIRIFTMSDGSVYREMEEMGRDFDEFNIACDDTGDDRFNCTDLSRIRGNYAVIEDNYWWDSGHHVPYDNPRVRLINLNHLVSITYTKLD